MATIGEKVEADKMKKMRNFVYERRPDLVMTRVPFNTLKDFRKFADDNFAGQDGVGDYGMALKFLFDSHAEKIKILENFNDIFASMNDLHKRLALLEDGKPEDTTRTIKKLDGSKIEVEKVK